MGKITVSWTEYENCPEASDFSKSMAYFKTIISPVWMVCMIGFGYGVICEVKEFFDFNDVEKFLMSIWYLIIFSMLLYFPTIYGHFLERGVHLRLLKNSMIRISKEWNDKLVSAYKQDAMGNWKSVTTLFCMKIVIVNELFICSVCIVYYFFNCVGQGGVVWLIVALFVLLTTIIEVVLWVVRHKFKELKEKHYANVQKLLCNDAFLEEYKNSQQVKGEEHEDVVLQQGGWRCTKCGKVHPSYTGTCGCGGKKNDVIKEQHQEIIDCATHRNNSDVVVVGGVIKVTNAEACESEDEKDGEWIFMTGEAKQYDYSKYLYIHEKTGKIKLETREFICFNYHDDERWDEEIRFISLEEAIPQIYQKEEALRRLLTYTKDKDKCYEILEEIKRQNQ